tara:strand:- start:8 stop:331 length:324 start_codon:yes stop_codon:yes gene_type:complete
MIRFAITRVIFIFVFLSVSIPLLLNIKINELSNNISEINNEILVLEREKAVVNLKHSEVFSIGNIENLSKKHSYVRLDISQKINKLEIPYKMNKEDNRYITILGYSR